MDYRLDMFRQMFSYMRCGKSKGKNIVAKPIFCLALIEWASKSELNELKWHDEVFRLIYRQYFKDFSNDSETPIWKPFYYLSSEPFYSLCWRIPPPKTLNRTIGSKYLRENLKFAKLDDDLWELLQSEDNREYLKKAIIETYLRNKII